MINICPLGHPHPIKYVSKIIKSKPYLYQFSKNTPKNHNHKKTLLYAPTSRTEREIPTHTQAKGHASIFLI